MTRQEFDAIAVLDEEESIIVVAESFAEQWHVKSFGDTRMQFLRHARERLNEIGVSRMHLVYHKTTTFGFVTK